MYKPFLDIGLGVLVALGVVVVASTPTAARGGGEGVPVPASVSAAMASEDSPYRAVTESPPHSLSTSHTKEVAHAWPIVVPSQVRSAQIVLAWYSGLVTLDEANEVKDELERPASQSEGV